MDSKEFDHLLGDKLGAEQSFDFQERDWVDLSQKLDEADGRKRRWPFWIWKGLLTAVVLGGILFLWKDLAATKKLVRTLEVNSKGKNIVVTDTIYHKVTITQYDTIQKTVFIEKLEESTLPTKEVIDNLENENPNFFIKEKKSEKDLMILKDKKENEFYQTPLNNRQKSILRSKTKEVVVSDFSEKLQPALIIDFRKNEVVQSQATDTWKGKQLGVVFSEDSNLLSNSIQKLPRKKRFSIGLLGAFYLPEEQSILGYIPDGFFNQNSQAFGVRTEFKLTDNWSITGDVVYQKTTFESNDPNFIQPLVLVDEILTGIDSLKIDETKLSYAIGLKYFLRKHRKIQPYTHLRLQAVGGLKQKITGVIPAAVYAEPIVYEAVEKRAGIALESMETGIGFQYRFLQNISWQTEGNYHFYLDEIDNSYRSNMVFKTSLLFHF